VEKEDIIEKFSAFLRENYYEDMVTAAAEDRKSLALDFGLLDKFDPDLADYVLDNPEEVFSILTDVVRQTDLPGEGKIKIRLFNLPESKNIRIRNVRAEHLDRLIVVDGQVKRASEVRPEVSDAVFQCPECGTRISIIQTEVFMKTPMECECGCRKGFKLIEEKLYDARWIAIEELFEITEGERPSEIRIFLKEDLTTPRMQNKTEPGNRIKIVGVLKQMPKRFKGGRSRQMDIYIDANNIESVETEWEELEIKSEEEKKIIELAQDPDIYNKLVKSIAPALFGMEDIKEAIVLQLFGGETHIQKDKSRVRGDIHILLVGDPSCLVADERVVMSDGTIMKIGEMGSRHLQKIDYQVHMGMGRKAGTAEIFHTYKKQPIIEIVTETGKSIKGTHNQPVLIVKNMQRSWKRLDETCVGERVQVLPKIECKKKTLVETNWKEPSYYHKSWHIKIPKFCDGNLATILGYIVADGWVQKRRVGFVINKDEKDILSKIENMFEKCFGIHVKTYEHKIASPQINYYQVDSTHAANLLSFLNEKRVPNLIWHSGNSVVASFLRWLYEGDGSVFSKGRGSLSVSLKSNNLELLRDVQILLLRFGIHSRILWENKIKSVKIKGREVKSKPSGSLMIRRSESVIKFWQNIGFASKKKSEKLRQAAEYAKYHIRRTHKSRTEKIVQINYLPPQDVFDIEVPKHQRFVANGIVVHNTAKSVLMKVVSGLIPRGRYVSGKGVTGAGLTATVVKDEEFLGGWVLEAGALVMCNRSLICIDEFEKIEKTDQVAMHEAMEQGSISIAKANIVATLPAQTAVLGGGNPKLGRFDPFMPIKEQIDVPETLLTRFDLKFALRDIPNPEQDARVAEHILKSRHFDEESAVPIIDSNLLKKYIAYTRKKIRPKLTREVGKILTDFFVKLRGQIAGEEAPVAITLRQYEALIRMTEASAKIQLRETVTVEDAMRAINLMKVSLRDFGLDQETGQFDIDRAEGHVTATQRSRIRALLDLISELENTFGKNVPVEEIKKRANQQNISNVDDLIRKMIDEGVVFEPSIGIIKRI